MLLLGLARLSDEHSIKTWVLLSVSPASSSRNGVYGRRLCYRLLSSLRSPRVLWAVAIHSSGSPESDGLLSSELNPRFLGAHAFYNKTLDISLANRNTVLRLVFSLFSSFIQVNNVVTYVDVKMSSMRESDCVMNQSGECEEAPSSQCVGTALRDGLSLRDSLVNREVKFERDLSPGHGPVLHRRHYRNLGKSGLRVSSIGLGTWVTFGAQISDEMAEEMVTLAYESGINIFDTAEVYAAGKAEIVLGNILKKKSWRRSSYIISTKLFWGGKAETEKGLSRKHIIEGLRNSLERLQLEYVDIVFANKPDPHTPTEEIVRAFTHVINQGWAMYWGTSRWNPMEIMEAYAVARQFNLIPPVAEQTEYHMFQREKVEIQMPELHHKIGIGTMTWSPLACGILTGKYDDGVPIYSRAALKGYAWFKDKILSEEGRHQQAKLREVACIADRIGCSLAQLAIAWCVKSEHVQCVLLGASSVAQLYENIQALQFVRKLSPEIMEHLEVVLDNNPVMLRRRSELLRRSQSCSSSEVEQETFVPAKPVTTLDRVMDVVSQCVGSTSQS